MKEVFKNRSQLQLAQGVASASVDATSRVSFYYAFGVLPDEQEAIEQFFTRLRLDKLNSTLIERDELTLCPGFNIVTESD